MVIWCFIILYLIVNICGFLLETFPEDVTYRVSVWVLVAVRILLMCDCESVYYIVLYVIILHT